MENKAEQYVQYDITYAIADGKIVKRLLKQITRYKQGKHQWLWKQGD